MITELPSSVMLRALQIVMSGKGRERELWLFYSAGDAGPHTFPFVLDDHKDFSRLGFRVPGTFSWNDKVKHIHDAILSACMDVSAARG